MNLNRQEELKRLFVDTRLSELLHIKKEDDYPEKNYSSLRFESNNYRIRAIELWEHKGGQYLRVYHANQIPVEIKNQLNEIKGQFSSAARYSNFRADYQQICCELYNILSSDFIIDSAKQNPILTRNSAYEGLELPDVDTSESNALGVTFNWKEIIAISEDSSEDNNLKNELSQCGVYLQRSSDGVSRYVGSAYNDGGILNRWLKHLKNNGDAKHLNLFILENGYSNIEFTVLEFTEKDDALRAESRWKRTLGCVNAAFYDGNRLNSN